APNGKTPPAVRMRLHDFQIVLDGARGLGMPLPASQSLTEALEVSRHELEVADALRGFLPRHAFDGVEGEQAHADLPGQRLGELGAHEGLEEDGGDLALTGRPYDGGEGGWARLGLGGKAGH